VDWVPVILFALLWAALVIRALVWMARDRKNGWNAPSLRWSAFVFFGGFVILSLFFYWMGYRFLSRHISFLFLPFLFMMLALFAQMAWMKWIRWAVLLLLICFAISSAQLLFHPAHMREDPKAMIDAWNAARHTNRSVHLWAFYPVQSVLYYAGEAPVPSLRGTSLKICKRLGPASYMESNAPAGVEVCRDAPVISLDSPARELWQQLLTSCHGQRVVMAFNRGTEFDHEALGRELLANPAAKAAKVGQGAFVECFECTIP
jgi:hypothetical protein